MRIENHSLMRSASSAAALLPCLDSEQWRKIQFLASRLDPQFRVCVCVCVC